jgi:hypothetical protein
LDTAKPPIIIFANEKRSVDALAKVIEKWGVNKYLKLKKKN